MKKIFAILAISAVSLTALAVGDQEEIIFDCAPEILQPDLGLHLQIREGGFAGLTRIEIKRFSQGHTQTDNYIVQQKPIDPHRPGAPRIYKGKGIAFSVNMTLAPRPDGTHLATLVTKQYGQETLSCKTN